MSLELNLNGKIAIITGGSKGLGWETAKKMSEEGAKLVLVSRNSDDLEKCAITLKKEYTTEIETIAADLSEKESADNVVEQTISRFKRIDILINSAGSAKGGIFWELSDDIWEEAYALKLFGTIRMIKAVVPIMKKQQYGRIVTIAGDSGKQPSQLMLPGSTANAALLALTKGVADAVGSFGISVNAVNPGPTRTERIKKMFESLSAATKKSVEEIEQDFVKDSPFKRVAEPAEIAKTILFLASDASQHITGSSITCDGGRTRTVA